MNKRARILTIAAVTAFAAASFAAVNYEMKVPAVHRSAAKMENTNKSAKRVEELVRPFQNRGYLRSAGPKRTPVPVFDSSLPVLYGSLLYSDADWFIEDDTYQVGYYAFQPESSLNFQPICVEANAYVNGGGAYSDRKLHYHLWEMYSDETSDTGITFHNYYCVVNTDEWSFINVVDYSDDQDNVSYDMTYDPVTKNLYSIQWGPYEDAYCDFALVDKDNGEASVIAKIPQMVALASDNYGELFCIGKDGNTYHLDKSDGSLICLGSTGVSPMYMQSATVDPESNDIYWAACTEYDGALYKLDTHTGGVVKIADMPDAEEFAGLFIEADRKGLDSPAALEDVRVSYADSQSVVSYKIPSKGFDGSTLSGDVTVKIYIDGVLSSEESGAPGATKEVKMAVSEGEHTLVMSAYNSAGEGPKTIRTQWTGNDVPGEVTDLHLELNGLVATLTWGAPVEGLHGGSVDASQITYTVKRYPGGVVVADNISETSFSETLPEGTATYYYTVTAYSPLGEGATTVSNSTFMGNAFTVPYSQDFEDGEDSLAGFTIINNEEGRGWFWWYNTAQNFKAMANKFNMSDACDNWLILPSIQFKASTDYKLRFVARVFSEDDPEKFEVTIGAGATAEAQTKKLMSATTIKNESDKIYEIPFTVASDGTWNIAFHCVSPVKAYYLIIDDISVTEASSSAVVVDDTPLPVTNAVATTEDGYNVKVTWTAPTQGVKGSELVSSNITYKVYANDGTVLADGLKGTSYTDTRYADATSQAMVYYQIHAQYGDNQSDGVLTDFVITGPDYDIPFYESFTSAGLDNTPWILSTLAGGVTGCWGLDSSVTHPDVTPYDSDEGFAYFKGHELAAGCQSRMTSPKMDLFSASHPVLSFMVYVPGEGAAETLDVQITHNDHEFTTLLNVPLTGESGWKQFMVEIPRIHCQEQTSVAFCATSAGYGNNICVDYITVTEGEASYDIDLQAVDIEMPDEFMPGETQSFTISIYNNGVSDVEDYKVALYCDGNVAMSTEGVKIASGETINYIFKATAEEEDRDVTYRFKGGVSATGDMNPSNDFTPEYPITIGVSAVELFGADGLRISCANGVLHISGAASIPVKVYTLSGLLVGSTAGEAEADISVPSGVLIVKAGNKLFKFRIK